jgi:hypothetical protein
MLLFEDKIAPLTSEIGLVECGLETASQFYFEWQKKVSPPGISVGVEEKKFGTLREAVTKILPIAPALATRSLFVGTRGPWVAFFENGMGGADAFPAMSFMAVSLGCAGVRVCAIPNTYSKKTGVGRYGAMALEVYGSSGDALGRVWNVSVQNEYGKWRFERSGAIQPFEDVERYGDKIVSKRFDLEMLERYLAAMGVTPFDTEFYRPERSVLISRFSPDGDVNEISLGEARARFGES